MDLAAVRSAQAEYSGTASKIVRALGLAGIGAIWVLREEVGGHDVIPDQLRRAGVLIVIGLLCDLLQYAVAALVWATYGRYKEVSLEDHNSHFLAPTLINLPALVFFVVKIIAMIMGYVVFLMYVGRTY